MPYPSQIDYDTLVATAAKLIEEEGVGALSLSKVADEFGVRAPSLYRHVANKAALLAAVNLYTLRRLFAEIDAALIAQDGDATVQLLAIAHALRTFAHANPRTYVMAMTAAPGEGRPDEELLLNLVLPIQARMAVLVGAEASLPALRGLLALVHGFIMLEVHEQLQRGGDLDATYDQAVGAYLAGWQLST